MDLEYEKEQLETAKRDFPNIPWRELDYFSPLVREAFWTWYTTYLLPSEGPSDLKEQAVHEMIDYGKKVENENLSQEDLEELHRRSDMPWIRKEELPQEVRDLLYGNPLEVRFSRPTELTSSIKGNAGFTVLEGREETVRRNQIRLDEWAFAVLFGVRPLSPVSSECVMRSAWGALLRFWLYYPALLVARIYLWRKGLSAGKVDSPEGRRIRAELEEAAKEFPRNTKATVVMLEEEESEDPPPKDPEPQSVPPKDPEKGTPQ